MAEFTGLMAPKLCLAGSNVKESWQTFKQQFNMYLLATGATAKREDCVGDYAWWYRVNDDNQFIRL